MPATSEEPSASPRKKGKHHRAKDRESDPEGTTGLHANGPRRTSQLHGLRLHTERQIHFHVRVGFQPSERFNLRNDPARLLAAADFIRQSQFLSGLGEQSNGVDGVIGVATLLHGPNRDDRGYFGERSSPQRAETEEAAARLDFSVADKDAHASEGDMEESEKDKQVRQSANRCEKHRNIVVNQRVDRATKNQRNDKKSQCAPRRSKRREIEFRTAAVHGNDNFGARRLCNFSRIRVDALRCGKTEAGTA